MGSDQRIGENKNKIILTYLKILLSKVNNFRIACLKVWSLMSLEFPAGPEFVLYEIEQKVIAYFT